jgi:hypothetical protein
MKTKPQEEAHCSLNRRCFPEELLPSKKASMTRGTLGVSRRRWKEGRPRESGTRKTTAQNKGAASEDKSCTWLSQQMVQEEPLGTRN